MMNTLVMLCEFSHVASLSFSPLHTLSDTPCMLFNAANTPSKEIARKYNPSSRIVLYGCAAASADDHCSSSASAAFDFEWAQVGA